MSLFALAFLMVAFMPIFIGGALTAIVAFSTAWHFLTEVEEQEYY